MKTKRRGLAVTLTIAVIGITTFSMNNVCRADEPAAAPLPAGVIPPPHPQSGQKEWHHSLTVFQVFNVLSAIKPTATFDDAWVGWAQAHLTAFVTEPATYAAWPHDEWLSVIAAYGIIDGGNIWDPFASKARSEAIAELRASGKPTITYREIMEANIWKRIPQAAMVKDIHVQDALFEWLKGPADTMFSTIPASHRDGYLELANHVAGTVGNIEWFGREKEYLDRLTAAGKVHEFTRNGPDGKPDPFRKVLAFLFRRVNDGTFSAARVGVLADEARRWLFSVHSRIRREASYVHGIDQSTHYPQIVTTPPVEIRYEQQSPAAAKPAATSPAK